MFLLGAIYNVRSKMKKLGELEDLHKLQYGTMRNIGGRTRNKKHPHESDMNAQFSSMDGSEFSLFHDE